VGELSNCTEVKPTRTINSAARVPHKGHISVAGQIVGTMTAAAHRHLSATTQIVFQDPMAALDTRMTVGEQIAEPLLIHGDTDPTHRGTRAAELMVRVGLTSVQLDNSPTRFQVDSANASASPARWR
jgi:peptide/nickel transport system ATP-binding protein